MKNYYIYLYFLNGELVYVGKTVDLYRRYIEHRNDYSHDFRYIDKVAIAKCNTEIDMDIYEIYYINKLRPKWNIRQASKGIPTIQINNPLNFKEYNIKEFVKKYYHLLNRKSLKQELENMGFKIDDIYKNSIYEDIFKLRKVGHRSYRHYYVYKSFLLCFELEGFLCEQDGPSVKYLTVFDGSKKKTFNSKNNPSLFKLNYGRIEIDIEKVLDKGVVSKSARILNKDMEKTLIQFHGYWARINLAFSYGVKIFHYSKNNIN